MDLLGASSSWAHTSSAQRLVAGDGSLEKVSQLVHDAGGRRLLLVTTPGRLAGEAGQALVRRLGRKLGATFDGTQRHVPTPVVQAAVGLAGEAGIDLVISFGGGSCVDLAKAVCFFTEQAQGQPSTSYLDRPVLPHIAIPTTWSGAELTPYFAMTDPAARRQQGAGSTTGAPVAAIYDPGAVVGLDPQVSAASGMSCLAHGVECAWSLQRSPEAEAVALACIARTAEALPAVVDDPEDLEARLAMLCAAALGARALTNAAMGVHHGLAQLLGGRTGLSHGLANAILLTHAVAYNAADPLLASPLHRIGLALGDPDDPAGAVDRLRERLGLPGHLADVGVSPDDIDAVARMSGASPAVRTNPRPVSEDEASGILAAAW